MAGQVVIPPLTRPVVLRQENSMVASQRWTELDVRDILEHFLMHTTVRWDQTREAFHWAHAMPSDARLHVKRAISLAFNRREYTVEHLDDACTRLAGNQYLVEVWFR
jgi:hypothetical protein